MAVRECPGCGNTHDRAPGRAGPTPRYCSPECQARNSSRGTDRRRAEERAASRSHIRCLSCGESLAHRRASKFCSLRCSEIARGTRRAEPLAERTCALPNCDVLFVPMRESTRCCSEVHGKRLWHLIASASGYKMPPRPWDGKRKEAHQRRRARKKGASLGQRVVAADIYDRDRWRCQLCKKRIDADLAWPDPMSASLDHVVPLSEGGSHDPANVQAAHLVCNVRKNNRGEPQQLALIG